MIQRCLTSVASTPFAKTASLVTWLPNLTKNEKGNSIICHLILMLISFLDVLCPGVKCDVHFTDEQFRTFASSATLANYESVLKTIPKNPQDPNLTIDDFYYTYNSNGILVHKETGDRFHWVNQTHYDLLGDLIVPYIQSRMKTEFGLIEEFLPKNDKMPNHLKYVEKQVLYR